MSFNGPGHCSVVNLATNLLSIADVSPDILQPLTGWCVRNGLAAK